MALLETDPLDVEVDDDGDILVDEDGLHLIAGLPGVAQLCRIAMLLFLGEWFLNLNRGMPWFQEILGEKYDEGLLRSRLAEQLLTVPGVTEVISITLAFDPLTRGVSVTWAVRTLFGDTEPDTLVAGGSSVNA